MRCNHTEATVVICVGASGLFAFLQKFGFGLRSNNPFNILMVLCLYDELLT